VRRYRPSRRHLLRGAVYGGGGLAAAWLLACGGDGGKTAPGGTPAGGAAAQQGTPKRGGTVRVPQSTDYNDVMDPHTSLFQAAIFFSYIGNTGLRLNREATELVPELIEKWEIPGDGTEMLLRVRQGVKWHDKPPIGGRTLDAQDVAYNLMRIAGKLNPPAEAARFQRRSTLEGMNRAEAVDATTVKVVFDRPTSTFLNGLTDFRNQYIPRDFIDKGGKFEDVMGLIGTGPFMPEVFRNNERATFKPNPTYWKQGADGKPLPYLAQMDWVWLPDPVSTLSAFSKGDIDYFVSPTKALRETLRKTVRDAREENWVFGNWNHFRFQTQKKPFDDPRVRRAMQLVLNYKTMNDAYYDEGLWDYTGPLPAAFAEGIPSDQIAKLPGWNPSTKAQDIQTAKQLMTAAGYPDGNFGFKVMIFGTQTGVQYDFAIRAIDAWKSAFPQMKPEADLPPDTTTFSRRQVQGDFEVLSYTLFPQPDAVLEMTANYHSTGSRNYGKFKDARIDALLEKAFGQLDRNARAATLKEFQDILINEQMPIITTSMPRQTVWFQARVKGMENYGGRIDGGGYDTQRHTEHMWLAT
jgi:ABC-type transport system substrate-binding protein